MKLLCVDKSAETCAKLLHKIHKCCYLVVQLLGSTFFDHYQKSYQIILFFRICSLWIFCFHLESSGIQLKDTSSSLGYYNLSLIPWLCILNPSLEFTAPQQRLSPSQCKSSRNTMVCHELIWVKKLSMKDYLIQLALEGMNNSFVICFRFTCGSLW